MGGSARLHHGLTKSQLIQMATLAKLQKPFSAQDAAEAFGVIISCASRYLRDLRRAGMLEPAEKRRSKYACLCYRVTETWLSFTAENADNPLLSGRCAGCGQKLGRDATLYREAFWCQSCLTDPRFAPGPSTEATCPRCGKRLDISERSDRDGYVIEVRCWRCRKVAEINGPTSEVAWDTFKRAMRPPPRPSSVPGMAAAGAIC